MKNLPKQIGPYRILKRLGQGGFATVYLAHPKDRDESQRIALKVLNSRENYGRFQREIHTVAELIHPNIIRIYDTGEDEETRTPYFSMEFISGGTLFERLESEQCLPRQEAVEIIKQIGSALIYPHQQGIIHCDVNPKNILLDTSFSRTRPVLTDFGLVKPLGLEGSELTDTIALIGTFAYYAPEQWNKEDVGPATDVYALAITLFEMLAGRRPFGGDVFSLREKHLYEPLPRLSSFVPEIGPFFDDILMRATAKSSSERYENVAQFIEAIDAANDEASQDEWNSGQERTIEVKGKVMSQARQDKRKPGKIFELIEADLENYLRLIEGSKLEAEEFDDELPTVNLAEQDERTSLLMLGGIFIMIGNKLLQEATETAGPHGSGEGHRYEVLEHRHVLSSAFRDFTAQPIQKKLMEQLQLQ